MVQNNVNQITSSLSCKICGSKDLLGFKLKEKMRATGEDFDYEGCSSCGASWICEVPANLSDYYGSNYYSHMSRDERGVRANLRTWAVAQRDVWVGMRKGWIGHALNLAFPSDEMRWIGRLGWEWPQRKSVLDVGCGRGDRLLAMRSMGFENLTGIDPFGTAWSSKDGAVRILAEDLSGLPLESKFDLIMMHHSLEHMENQHSVMIAANALLAPGGKIVVRIPLSDSWAKVNYGENWVQWDAPRHVFMHSNQSFLTLAESSGFRVLSSWRDSKGFQLWGSEQYVRGMPLADHAGAIRPSAIFGAQKLDDYENKAKELNKDGTGDQGVYILESNQKERLMNFNSDRHEAKEAKMKSKILVITRTKNRNELLARALESAAKQTMGDYIQVVVNDGGDKAGVEAVVERARKVHGAKVHMIHNVRSLGMEAASICAVEAVDSDYITILDDDDSWEHSYLELMSAKLDQGYAGVACQSVLIHESMEAGVAKEQSREMFNVDVNGVTLFKMCMHPQFTTNGFMFTRSAYAKAGGFNPKLPVVGDWDFNLRFMMDHDIEWIASPLAHYHIRLAAKDMPNSNFAASGIKPHDEWRARLLNKKLREDLVAGKLGLGSLMNLAQEFQALEVAAKNPVYSAMAEFKTKVPKKISKIKEWLGWK